MDPYTTVDGEPRFTLKQVFEDVGVCRQTVYLWRRGGKVPNGTWDERYGRVLYTTAEVERVRKYARRRAA